MVKRRGNHKEKGRLLVHQLCRWSNLSFSPCSSPSQQTKTTNTSPPNPTTNLKMVLYYSATMSIIVLSGVYLEREPRVLWTTTTAVMEQFCLYDRVWQYACPADRKESLGIVFTPRICSRDPILVWNIAHPGAGIRIIKMWPNVSVSFARALWGGMLGLCGMILIVRVSGVCEKVL